MSHVVERSELNHHLAYRMSRVFDEMRLGLVTQQIATFDRLAEHRLSDEAHVDWDAALHEWVRIENHARARNAARHGGHVVLLPIPTSLIVAHPG